MAKLTKSAKEVRGRHQLTVRVKTSKYRDKSSNRWLERQLNDPYVAESKRLGYRSRAAFKLIQLDEKYRFLGKGRTIVDLGCAPGGWTQVAVMRNKGTGQVVGMDILETQPIEGATLIQQDFTEADAADRLKALLNGKADIVMSDMAANTTGHQQTDHCAPLGWWRPLMRLPKRFWPTTAFLLPRFFRAGRKVRCWPTRRKTLKRSGTASLTPADRVRRKRISSVRDFAAVCVKKRKASL